jgi:hypothetical protein
MSEIKVSNISNRAGTSGAVIAGVTSSIGTGSARLASGDNSERVGIESGSIRYNETSKLLEFYDGTQWNFIIPAEESANALGVHGLGYTWTETSELNYVTISTKGDAQVFGNLLYETGNGGGCSSSTRGVYGGGSVGGSGNEVNTMNFITIATTGNATNFGQLTQTRRDPTACSSSTRGVFGGGITGTGGSRVFYNVMDYITIATTSNALTFGQLTSAKAGAGACSSSTRGVFGGGWTGTVELDTIDYITIATLSNALTFGQLTEVKDYFGACSSSTRGVFGGGYTNNSSFYSATINYITIATTGNAINFGQLSAERASLAACSSSTRAVFFGGYGPPFIGTPFNNIQYITIATTGNAINFGNLLKPSATYGQMAVSNNHGGLL